MPSSLATSMLVAVATVLLLGGCASMMDFAGVPRAGHQANGTYVVSGDEEKLACRQIKERIEMLSRDLQTLPQKAAFERESTPNTVGSAVGRIFGGPDGGLKATADYQRAQAESDALKGLYARKQCV